MVILVARLRGELISHNHIVSRSVRITHGAAPVRSMHFLFFKKKNAISLEKRRPINGVSTNRENQVAVSAPAPPRVTEKHSVLNKEGKGLTVAGQPIPNWEFSFQEPGFQGPKICQTR